MTKEKERNIMFIVCALVILIAVYNSNKYTSHLKKDYSFTVGKTLKYKYADGFKDCIEYKYFVDSLKYIGLCYK